jgi:hypothetical protein
MIKVQKEGCFMDFVKKKLLRFQESLGILRPIVSDKKKRARLLTTLGRAHI